MFTWEYSVRHIHGNLEEILNKAGAEGWQLVATARDNDRFIFMRPAGGA